MLKQLRRKFVLINMLLVSLVLLVVLSIQLFSAWQQVTAESGDALRRAVLWGENGPDRWQIGSGLIGGDSQPIVPVFCVIFNWDGTVSMVLDDYVEITEETLAQAVTAGDYDGLALDMPKLGRADRKALTQLAKALDKALGDAELCLIVEAPAWQGKTYEGYDYKALAASADRLVARIGSYEAESGGFPTAPVNPLEEVYYTLATLRDEAGAEKVTILLDTDPAVWDNSGRQHSLTAEDAEDADAIGVQLVTIAEDTPVWRRATEDAEEFEEATAADIAEGDLLTLRVSEGAALEVVIEQSDPGAGALKS